MILIALHSAVTSDGCQTETDLLTDIRIGHDGGGTAVVWQRKNWSAILGSLLCGYAFRSLTFSSDVTMSDGRCRWQPIAISEANKLMQTVAVTAKLPTSDYHELVNEIMFNRCHNHQQRPVITILYVKCLLFNSSLTWYDVMNLRRLLNA